ncbi:hypothetical protein K8I31_17930, partial [bacterium]|nr:hypothetical protein [bacterium]
MMKIVRSLFQLTIVMVLVLGHDNFAFCDALQSEEHAVVVSEDEFLQWRHWDKNNGLTSDWVNYLSYDKKGNIWLSADSHAHYFDGYTFETYPFDLGYRTINRMDDGTIWAVNEKGIQLYIDGEWVDHDFGYNSKFSILSRFAVFMHDSQFLISSSNELFVYDAGLRSKTILAYAADTPLKQFYEVRRSIDGAYWVMGQTGVAEIKFNDGGSKQSTELNFFLYPEELHYVEPRRMDVYPNREVSVTLATEDKRIRHFIHLSNGKWSIEYSGQLTLGWLGPNDGFWFTRLNEDGTRYLLFYQSGSHLYQVKPNKYNRTIFSIVSYSRDSFFICNENGLTAFQAPLWQTDLTFPGNDKSTLLAGLVDSRDAKWVASQSVLYKNDGDGWTEHVLPTLDDDIVVNKTGPDFRSTVGRIVHGNMFEMQDGTLYLIGYRALSIFDREQVSFDIFYHPDSVSKLYDFTFNGAHILLPDGSLLISVNVGEQNEKQFDLFKNGRFETYQDLSSLGLKGKVSSIIQRGPNTFWFVLDTKLFKLEDGAITPLDLSPEIDRASIEKIHLIDDNQMWIETGDSFYVYDQSVRKRIAKNGAERTSSFQKTADGAVWFCSTVGVSRYVDDSVIVNDAKDGLFDEPVFFLIHDSEGRFYAGGESGLKIYNHNLDIEPPETFIPKAENSTEFSSNSLVRFVFDANDRWDYTSKERILYSYQFDDQAWSPFQPESTITKQDLSWGEHQLQVRSIDRNLNIDQSPATLNFHINPPWYCEPVFLIWSAFASMASLFFAYLAVRNYSKLKLSLFETQKTVLLLERVQERMTGAKIKAEEEKIKAETATKAKDGFLARMSHEIRTPLNGIIGNLELVNDQELSADSKNYIQTARVSAKTLVDMVGEVLDFAKIESGKFGLDLQPYSVKKLFEEAVAVVSSRAKEKKLDFNFEINSELPGLVEIDPVRFRQVLLNLLGNAIKFTDRGSVTAKLDLEKKQDEAARIRFEVK